MFFVEQRIILFRFGFNKLTYLPLETYINVDFSRVGWQFSVLHRRIIRHYVMAKFAILYLDVRVALHSDASHPKNFGFSCRALKNLKVWQLSPYTVTPCDILCTILKNSLAMVLQPS